MATHRTSNIGKKARPKIDAFIPDISLPSYIVEQLEIHAWMQAGP
jgi:hypothetical protein